MQRVSLAAQIDAITSARTYVAGGAPKARPAERQDIDRRLNAATRTLQWLSEHEAHLRAAIGARPE